MLLHEADYHGNKCLYYILLAENSVSSIEMSCLHLSIETPFEVPLVAVNERSIQQVEHNGSMIVKCFEVLHKISKRGSSDLPDGIALPINSLQTMQTLKCYIGIDLIK